MKTRLQWVHPTLPRFYVCSGVRTLASVLDQTTDSRVAFCDTWEQASAEAKRLNEAAGADGVPWLSHLATEDQRAAEVEAIASMPLVGSLARFVAVGCKVLDCDTLCGLMRSHSFAKRTANALNNHKPTREGV